MTRLAVVADVHADDFGSKVDPASGLNARWLDSVAMLEWVALDARQRGADALVIAGDLTEARHPAPWRVAHIQAAIALFDGPTILVRGNHDGIRNGASIVDLLAHGRPGWSGFSMPGIVMVGETAVAAIPYLDQHHLRALPEYSSVPPAEAFAILGDAFLEIARGLFVQAHDMAPTAVLVVHQGLAGGLMSDSQAAFLGDQSLVVDTRALGAIGFDAILAGHFHKHQVLSEAPLVAYAGSPYRADFGEERQPKGYLVVDVAHDGTTGIPVVAWTFVETPARRFVTLTAAEVLHDMTEEDLAASACRAVVRVVDADAEDLARIRQILEPVAFDVTEIRRRPVEQPTIEGGLSEGLTAHQALDEYFAGDDDRDALVARGRELLEAVA